MPDPFGSNIDANRAALAERADPNFADTKIATRVRQLRVEVDSHVDGVTEASVLAVLDDSNAAKDMGTAQVTNCTGLISPNGSMLAISSDTGTMQAIGASPRIGTDAIGLGFFGVAGTPIAQPAIVALTDQSGGVGTDDTILVVTNVATAADAITELAVKVNEIRTALVNLGLIG